MGAVKEQKNVLLQPLDTTIELVSCGSSYSDMPSFSAWELTMLDECYDNIDCVSLHRYYANPTADTPGFLARSMDLDDFIHTVVSICDAVKGKKRSKKRVNLSFDEWTSGTTPWDRIRRFRRSTAGSRRCRCWRTCTILEMRCWWAAC